MNVLCSWSGGKDSCYALMKAVDQGMVPKVLLNMMNENGKVSRSHGLALEILQEQAKAIGVPILNVPSTWGNYEENFISQLKEAKEKYSLEGAVFGDIDIEQNRAWEEKVSKAASLKPVLPLWQNNRVDLVKEMISNGIEAIIVSCQKQLGEDFLGRRISPELLNEFTRLGIDECGENGEYHTAVLNCPLFRNRVELPSYSKATYENYCFLTW